MPVSPAVRPHASRLEDRVAVALSGSYNWDEPLEIVGEITDIEIVARGVRVRDRSMLRRRFGRGMWRKMKGIALVRVPSGAVRRVEIHWYEAHGMGRRLLKIKRYLEPTK